MSKKQDVTKLAFFSESTLQRMQIEINRVSQLYRADRIGGIRGHEMLHQATRDINSIFWQVSAMIGQEHNKIDSLHMARKFMKTDYLNYEDVKLKDMEVKKVPQASNKAI